MFVSISSRTRSSFACLLASVFLLAACAPAGPQIDGTPGTSFQVSGQWRWRGWTLDKVCETDYFEDEVASCYATHAGYCRECIALCARSGICQCSGLCATPRCSRTPLTSCRFAFTNRSKRNEPLFHACERAAERNNACGQWAPSQDACNRFARAEVAAAYAAYDCIASLECSADTSSACLSEPVTEALVPLVCTEPGVCSDDMKTLLHAESGWASQDAIAALDMCNAQQALGERSQCVSAWLREVYGDLGE